MTTRIISALALLTVAGACSRKTEIAATPQAVAVERRTITIDASATGVVEPINVVEVKSKASGIITRMTVETGAQVKPGDLLVQVDTRDVQNQYDQAMADVRAAEARLQVAQAQKKRSDEMHAARVITAQEHETSSLDYTNAQAQVVRARASLDLAKQRLEDATVTAPVAGTVIEKTVSLGQVITSATGAFGGGTTLLKMADLARVRVRALFNETDIGQVSPGQMATVTVDAYPDRRFQGLVEKIEPQAVVQQGVTLFPVLVTLENLEGLLKPGMNGEVSVLIDERENVLAIPNDAVKSTREAAATAPMLGLDADSVAASVRVQLAAIGGGRGGLGGRSAQTEPAAGGTDARSIAQASGSVAPTADGSARRARRTEGGAGGAAGTIGSSRPATDGNANGVAPNASSGGEPGRFAGGVDPTDADCAKVTAALAKGGAQAKLDALRARVQAGEMDRTAMREESQAIYAAAGVDGRTSMACRRRSGGAGAMSARAGDNAAGTRTGMATTPVADPGRRTRDAAAGAATQAMPATPRRTRPQPRLVYVEKATATDTTWEPRVITVGASNFDYTEVLSGVQEGEKVATLASLTLQAQRQAQNERFRQGMGGVPGLNQNPGGGGRGGPGGGGGGAPAGGRGGAGGGGGGGGGGGRP